MTNEEIRVRLKKFLRKEDCSLATNLTAQKIADKIGCSRKELDTFIRSEFKMGFGDWKQDPGVSLGYPQCVSCRKHRRGRPFGRGGETYQCLVCGRISEKKNTKYHQNGTMGVSDATPISFPSMRNRN